jgi:hypothetical protein
MKHFLLLLGGTLFLAGCNTLDSGNVGGTGSENTSISTSSSSFGPPPAVQNVAPGDSVTRAFPSGTGAGTVSTGAH